MQSSSPLPADDALPDFSRMRPEHVIPAIDRVLADFRTHTDALEETGAPCTFDHVILPLERLAQRLARIWAPVSQLHNVTNSAALRKVYGPAEQKLTEHAITLKQNAALYAKVQALANTPDFDTLPRPQRAATEHALRDFRLSGVTLPESSRRRFRQIGVELSRLTCAFSDAVLDATESWHVHLTDEHDLAGIPASGRAVLRQYAKAQGLEGFLVTLKEPSVQAILGHADNPALRERVYWAYQTRASDQGPHAGRYDNTQRIEQIMALRHESARLLGFANAAEAFLATRMAASPTEVMGFLHDLVARAKPVAKRELTELRTFAQKELGLDNLAPWNIQYATEKLRQHRHALEEEALKPYFALPVVIEGLWAIAHKLYSITFVRRKDVVTWHPDVHYYDLKDAAGYVFAGIYLDLCARPGKRSGAWMDVCHTRFDDWQQQPVVFINCNFPPATAEQPVLLSHEDVLTLLHEFGHGLHHLLTDMGLPSVSGLHGVEWDAVELPSQLMEHFGWHHETLDLLARHWQSGARLPEALFQKIQTTRHFHCGLNLIHQLELALFDFTLHLNYQPEKGARVLAVLEEVRKQVTVLHPPAWQRFPHSFIHIFADDYAAGYYSYLWAERLSTDAFEVFEEAVTASGSVLDATTGARFRRAFLAVGSSRGALENFIAFRGRPPESTALLRHYGLD